MPAVIISINTIKIKEGVRANLVVGETMEETSCLDMFDVQDDITISASGCCSHDILVERKRDESNHEQEVHHSAYCAHCFRSAKDQ